MLGTKLNLHATTPAFGRKTREELANRQTANGNNSARLGCIRRFKQADQGKHFFGDSPETTEIRRNHAIQKLEEDLYLNEQRVRSTYG